MFTGGCTCLEDAYMLPARQFQFSISGAKLTATSGPPSLCSVTPFVLSTASCVNILGLHKIIYLWLGVTSKKGWQWRDTLTMGQYKWDLHDYDKRLQMKKTGESQGRKWAEWMHVLLGNSTSSQRPKRKGLGVEVAKCLVRKLYSAWMGEGEAGGVVLRTLELWGRHIHTVIGPKV